MNETQIRRRLRVAVGETRVPPDLRNRVETRLKSSERVKGGSLMFGFGRTASVVAAVLALFLVAVAVIGIRAWHDSLVNSRPASPAVQNPTVSQYQAMLRHDEAYALSKQANACNTLTDSCPTAAPRLAAALQQWLDDLTRSRPPSRFAYVDAELRRHVTACIKDLNAAVAAYNAQDQGGMEAAITAGVAERDAFVTEVGDIVGSSQTSASVYTISIRGGQSRLLGCSSCQSLAKAGQVTCAVGDLQCASDIASMTDNVEAFEGDLIHDFAPDSLASKDARLQADLWAADQALVAMQTAWSANDKVALQTAHDAFAQAYARAEADVAAILS